MVALGLRPYARRHQEIGETQWRISSCPTCPEPIFRARHNSGRQPPPGNSQFVWCKAFHVLAQMLFFPCVIKIKKAISAGNYSQAIGPFIKTESACETASITVFGVE